MRHRLAAILVSCVVLLIPPAAADTPVLEAETSPPQAEATCYMRSLLNHRRWERLDWEELSCYAQDSCHGGLGRFGGGCYKWARGPEDPPLPWSAEVTGDEPPGRPLPTDEGLPLEYGLFAFRTNCAEDRGACPVLRWRANARVPLYAEPNPTSRRVGRLNNNEVVVMLEEARFVAAQRGTVIDGYNGMNAGDVVYAVEEVCKWQTVWRRGDLIRGVDGGVEWEPQQRLYNPSAGPWVRFERANGQRGWARASVVGHYLTQDPPPVIEPVQEGDEYEFDECE